MDLFGNRKINRAFKLENKWARNIGANRSAPRDRPIALLVFARYTESYLTWQVRFDHRLQGIGQEILRACHASRENLQEINLSLPWAVETVKNHRWIVDCMVSEPWWKPPFRSSKERNFFLLCNRRSEEDRCDPRVHFTRLNRVDNNAIFAVAQISFSFERLLLDSRGTKRDFRWLTFGGSIVGICIYISSASERVKSRRKSTTRFAWIKLESDGMIYRGAIRPYIFR